MLTHRGGNQGGPGMSSLTISGMAPEVVAHCMDLKVLDVDHAPHDVVPVLHRSHLSRGMLQYNLGHIHGICMVRNHLLHERDNGTLVAVKAHDAHFLVHHAIDCLHALLKVCVVGPG